MIASETTMKTFRALMLTLDQYALYVHKLNNEWVARIDKKPTGLMMIFKRSSQADAQHCAITMALRDAGLSDSEISKEAQSLWEWKSIKLVLED
jgi:hypothetical protein